jgi:hypothetical protein
LTVSRHRIAPPAAINASPTARRPRIVSSAVPVVSKMVLTGPAGGTPVPFSTVAMTAARASVDSMEISLMKPADACGMIRVPAS